jgi:hypothetical protein
MKMWKDHTVALRAYILESVRLWGERITKKGVPCSNEKMLENIAKYDLALKEGEKIEFPPWWGDPRFHDSHKAMLFHKGRMMVESGQVEKNPYEEFSNFAHITGYYWPYGLKTKREVTSENSVLHIKPASKKQEQQTDEAEKPKKRKAAKKKLEKETSRRKVD